MGPLGSLIFAPGRSTKRRTPLQTNLLPKPGRERRSLLQRRRQFDVALWQLPSVNA